MDPDEKKLRRRERERRYERKHRDKHLAKRRRHRERNRTALAEKQRVYAARNPKAQRERVALGVAQRLLADPSENSQFRRVLICRRAKRRALEFGRAFDITPEDFAVPELCPLLGIRLVSAAGRGKPGPNSPSLDRIDNSKGYIKGNVWVISHRANSLKGCLSVDEVRNLIQTG